MITTKYPPLHAVKGDVLNPDRPFGLVRYLSLRECQEIDGDAATYPSRTEVVAEVTVGDAPETAESDANRLALCWNTHDELVEACKAARTKLESLNQEHNQTGVMLDEVLAKVEPTP